MISLDWKERLINDTKDFFERKLPQNDYDFDIIYNAYPERVDNKIPREVVVLVATTLANLIGKNHYKFKDFFEYIWNKKGENGKIAFACLVSKFKKYDYKFYFEFAKKNLFNSSDAHDTNILIDKVFYPIFKKYPEEHIDTLIHWLREDNDIINQHLIKIPLKIGKNNSEYLSKFSSKLENRWLGASAEYVKISGLFLKQLYKLDKKLYLKIYKNYINTREPVFVEILTSGLTCYEDFLLEAYDNWSKSGNARLKKAALTGYKYLIKKKGKN